jgi:hypothetical protein
VTVVYLGLAFVTEPDGEGHDARRLRQRRRGTILVIPVSGSNSSRHQRGCG